MRLYLADEEKITSYELPEKAEESFLFTYVSSFTNIEVYLNIYSLDGNWYLKNRQDLEVINTQNDVLLENFSSYQIKIKGLNTPVNLFTYPSYNDDYRDVNIQGVSEIKIGTNPDNEIVYKNNDTAEVQDIIKLNGNAYLITHNDQNTKTYLNNRLLKDTVQILTGDTIFLNNLKIVWMNTFIRVFIPNNSVSFSQNLTFLQNKVVDNSSFLAYTPEENDKSIYREDDFFYHKPRLINSFDEEKIVIDAPGSKLTKEDIPFIFSAGAGVTMVLYSVINLVNNITRYKKGEIDKSELIPTIVIAVAMLIFGFLLPKIAQIYNKRRDKKREALRQKKYNEYLDQKQEEISNLLKEESDALFKNNPSSEESFNIIVGAKERLWEREFSDKDFLTVRLGTGVINSLINMDAPQKRFSIDEDNLLERVQEIINTSKTIPNVPITMSLVENNISSIVCNNNYSNDYINGILLQLLSMHNPNDLKIVVLTSEQNKYKWQYIKLIPHIYSEDKSLRFFATNEDEATNVMKEIDSIYNERNDTIKDSSNNDNYYLNFHPYYLIITDDFKKYKTLLNTIIKSKNNVGFSALLIDNSLRNIPNECNKYVYINNDNSVIFEKDYNKNNQITFTPETFQNLDVFRAARELSNVPVQSSSEMNNLPTSLTFLEMYNVGNIEQLNIMNKWISNNPVVSLQTPIGVHPSGELFKLDLHEKAHGPHGLIAGSTGSGKSEFIITFILSMAINYHPNEVQFVIIDYKGGGLAGAFENRETGIHIPHLAGTITNLDVSEMNRTLVSINSELKRRQRKFNEARDKLGESTIDIYKYQKYYREGLLDEPISHLFIISDEFAELKAQQPDFMDELISISRIGRSLGVHLILATQKPAGVVNDQIWSNSRFKVCLKVQTTSDSNEMLKRPEAASIKDVGRFYLQVGYDELFNIGQAAWAGAKYIPTEKVIKAVDDSVCFIGNNGDIIKSINTIKEGQKSEKRSDQLTSIVKYLNDISVKNNISTNKLWLNSLPEEILHNNLITKYNYKAKPFQIEAIIGEYDNPAAQLQNILKLDITNTGNTIIYGMPGSGKENLITTIIHSICTRHVTDEIMIYIMDFGSETLKKFEKYPQVGDVVFIDEKEKINNLISVLQVELNRRKDLFSDYLGTYNNFIKQSGKTLPQILCIIHGYENLDENNYAIHEKLYSLFKDGQKYGINFILTNSLASGIRNRVLQMFNNKITLKLADNDDYHYVVDAPRNLIPAKYFGRGIANLADADGVYEFQTAYISKPDEITNTISEVEKILNAKIQKRAPKVPVLPDFLTVDRFMNKKFTLQEIPVGITKHKLSICSYDFSKSNFNPIITSDVNSNIHFVYGLIEILKQIDNCVIRVIDVLKIYNNSQGVFVYNDDYDKLTKQIKIEILNDAKLKKRNIFIIIGLGSMKNNVSEKTKAIFDDIFDKIKTYKNNTFIIYDDYNSYKTIEMEKWFRPNVDQTNGIWLGENASSQISIKMPNLSMDEKKVMFNQIGYVVKNSNHTIVRYIVDKEFDNEK